MALDAKDRPAVCALVFRREFLIDTAKHSLLPALSFYWTPPQIAIGDLQFYSEILVPNKERNLRIFMAPLIDVRHDAEDSIHVELEIVEFTTSVVAYGTLLFGLLSRGFPCFLFDNFALFVAGRFRYCSVWIEAHYIPIAFL